MPKSMNAFTSTLQAHEQNKSVSEIADQFIATLHQLIARRGYQWHAPTTSYQETDDSIEISWWRVDKSLIVTVAPDSPLTFLKVWGPNIHTDMDGGENPSEAQLIELWQWLYA